MRAAARSLLVCLLLNGGVEAQTHASGTTRPESGAGPRGSRIVSVNPRFSDVFPGRRGFEDNPAVDALSYHIHNPQEARTCLGNSRFGKPVILSDDGKAAEHAELVLGFIESAAEAGEHFEHFDWHLGDETGGRAHHGARIDGPEDFPEASRKILSVLGGHATRLTPGGKLTREGNAFHWNGRPVTLMGSSSYGALVSLNFDIDGYLDVLARHGVNLTRVWCVEQWSATAWRTDNANGLTPFAYEDGRYDLTRLNDAFFKRARRFVNAAASRGIVVQLTLFDRCGVAPTRRVGEWADSPYNSENNANGFLTPPAAAGGRPGGRRYPAITGMDGTPIGRVNRAFIDRVVRELGDCGNVIYEIMNEPHHYWPNQTQWHGWVAGALHDSFASLTSGPADGSGRSDRP